MNRINPLYIIAFIIILLLVLILNLNSAKNDLVDAQEKLKQTSQLTTELTGLKGVYGDKNKAKSSIQRILRQGSLKSSDIKQTTNKSGITLSSDIMELSALNLLMGKLFNGTYNISTFNVKKLSETKVSLHVEIKW